MLDTITVSRKTGETTDPETGDITPTVVTVYTGKGKIQQAAVPVGAPQDVGQASVQVMHMQLHLPIAATGVLIDDVATVTASVLDPDLVGRTFTIRSLDHKTFLTARRMDVQELGS